MNLIQFLKTNENSRKIFGKRELKIIEKQLNGINLTQSEKNRLSRDIRKKFQFIKEASRFSEEFDLKKANLAKQLVNEAKEVILKNPLVNKIKKIILFGSFVDNKMTLHSDIDIAIVFDEINKKDAGKFRIYALGRVDKKIDIQIYNTLPEKIKKEIDTKGEVIYENAKGKR